MGEDAVLTNFSEGIDRRFQAWTFKKQAGKLKFSDEQMSWLRLIKEHIGTTFDLEVEDLEQMPFRERGGAMRMYEVFQDKMLPIIEELNMKLAA